MTESAPRPLLRVVRGEATPEELAALVAVVTARLATANGDSAAAPSRYADPAAAHRAPVRVNAGAWVASGRLPGTRTRAAW